MTSFLIADDHAISRMGVISYIKEFFKPYYIEEADNGDELFEKLKHREFDILISDINMPHTDMYSIVDTSLFIRPKLRILIVSMNKEELFASTYLKKGAKGYLEKNAAGDEIVKAIQTVLAGNIYVSPSITNAMVMGDMQIKNSNPLVKLAGRELQICILLCEGKSVSDIASILNLGMSTVSTNKAKIFAKLGIDNLADLIKISTMNA